MSAVLSKGELPGLLSWNFCKWSKIRNSCSCRAPSVHNLSSTKGRHFKKDNSCRNFEQVFLLSKALSSGLCKQRPFGGLLVDPKADKTKWWKHEITPSRADPYKHTIVGPIGFSRSQIDNAIWHGSSGYTHIVYYQEEVGPYVVGAHL